METDHTKVKAVVSAKTLRYFMFLFVLASAALYLTIHLYGNSQRSAFAASTPGEFCTSGGGEYGSLPISCSTQGAASQCPTGCGCVPVSSGASWGYCRYGAGTISSPTPRPVATNTPPPAPTATRTPTPRPGTTITPTPTVSAQFPIDLTNSVVDLGNPNKTINKTSWSLNVYDMQEYQGSIYFGGGGNNDNKGPTNIWKINDSLTAAVADYVGNVETLYRLSVIDNILYVPDADPLGSESDRWLFAKNQSAAWVGLPGSANTMKSAHMVGVYKHQNLLFVSGSERLSQTQSGGSDTKPMIWISANGGTTFVRAYTDTKDPAIKRYINSNRGSFDNLFTLGSNLYVTAGFSQFYDSRQYPQVLRYDSTSKTFESTGSFDVFQWIPQSKFYIDDPYGQNRSKVAFPHSPINVDNALMYIAKYELGQSNFGLTLKRTETSPAEGVVLPYDAVAEDVIYRNGSIYVLANALIPTAPNQQTKKPFAVIFRSNKASTSASDWKELIRIANPNGNLNTSKAMSFEMTANNIYMTYGIYYPQTSSRAGDLLRVPRPAGF